MDEELISAVLQKVLNKVPSNADLEETNESLTGVQFALNMIQQKLAELDDLNLKIGGVETSSFTHQSATKVLLNEVKLKTDEAVKQQEFDKQQLDYLKVSMNQMHDTIVKHKTEMLEFTLK